MTLSFRLSSASVVAQTYDAEAGSDRTAAAEYFCCSVVSDLHEHRAVELQHLVARGIEASRTQRSHAPARLRRQRPVLDRGASVADGFAGIDRLQPFEVLEPGRWPEFQLRPRAVPWAAFGGAGFDVALHPRRGRVPAGR